MKIYDPCGRVDVAPDAPGSSAAPGSRPASVRGLRVGLLDNGKPNAGVLLRAMADRLVSAHGAVAGSRCTKGPGANAATPAHRSVLDRLSKEVDVTLVGSAD